MHRNDGAKTVSQAEIILERYTLARIVTESGGDIRVEVTNGKRLFEHWSRPFLARVVNSTGRAGRVTVARQDLDNVAGTLAFCAGYLDADNRILLDSPCSRMQFVQRWCREQCCLERRSSIGSFNYIVSAGQLSGKHAAPSKARSPPAIPKSFSCSCNGASVCFRPAGIFPVSSSVATHGNRQ